MQAYPRIVNNGTANVASHYVLQQKMMKRLKDINVNARGNRCSEDYKCALEDRLLNMTYEKMLTLQNIESETEFVSFIFDVCRTVINK